MPQKNEIKSVSDDIKLHNSLLYCAVLYNESLWYYISVLLYSFEDKCVWANQSVLSGLLNGMLADLDMRPLLLKTWHKQIMPICHTTTKITLSNVFNEGWIITVWSNLL